MMIEEEKFWGKGNAKSKYNKPGDDSLNPGKHKHSQSGKGKFRYQNNKHHHNNSVNGSKQKQA